MNSEPHKPEFIHEIRKNNIALRNFYHFPKSNGTKKTNITCSLDLVILIQEYDDNRKNQSILPKIRNNGIFRISRNDKSNRRNIERSDLKNNNYSNSNNTYGEKIQNSNIDPTRKKMPFSINKKL